MTALAHPAPPAPALVTTAPISQPPEPEAYAALRVLADTFFDVQQARIAITNRTSAKTLKDGSVIPAVVAPEVLAPALADIRAAEKKIGSAMRAEFRKAAPEVWTWVKETPGVGGHLVARLLGTIGHPVIAQPYHWEGEGADRVLIADEPFRRNVGKLWALCGHGDPARRRRKGMSAQEAMALGNPHAKMLVRLIAEGCMKCVGSTTTVALPMPVPSADTDLDGEAKIPAHTKVAALRRRSPYRDVYDHGRLLYGQRAEWTDLHRHNAALRLVGKEVLRDLWLVAQGHEPATHGRVDAQSRFGAGS